MKKKKSGNLPKDSQGFESVVAEGVKLEEPERTKYFETLIKNNNIRGETHQLQMILKRIKIIVKHVDGFVPEENTKFQNAIIRGFYHKLADKYLIEYLRDQQRRLIGLVMEIKKEMDSLPIYTFGPPSANRYLQLKPYYEYNSRLNEWLGEIIERFTQEKSYWVKVQNKKIKITNEMVAGFCKLVHESALPYNKPEHEGAEIFCTMICNLYKLPYKTRVRIAYSQHITKELASKIETAILPKIPTPDRGEIEEVINSLSGKK